MITDIMISYKSMLIITFTDSAIDLTQVLVDAAVLQLIARPRKRLDYRTLAEVFKAKW
jgi:IS30 family transposase